jgi:hypothetical protein
MVVLAIVVISRRKAMSKIIFVLALLVTSSVHAGMIDFTGLTDNTGANGEVNGTEYNSQGLDLTLLSGINFNVGCGTGTACLGADLSSVNDFTGVIRGNFVVAGTSDNGTVSSLLIDYCCTGTVTKLFDINDSLISTITGDLNYSGSTAVSYFDIDFAYDAMYSISFDGLTTSSVPEPSSLVLMGLGLIGLGYQRKRS